MRAKFFRRTRKKVGEAPGALIHEGDVKADQVRIQFIDFDATHFQEKEIDRIEDAFPLKDKPTVTWINIDGLHQPDLMEKIGVHFRVHPLTLEDVMNAHHRPKAEDFDDYLFLIIKMLHYHGDDNRVISEQISFVLGDTFLISFQEKQGDILDNVRERIRKGKGKIRKKGGDYLLYALMDAVVDHYYLIVSDLGEKIETLEEELLASPSLDVIQDIHELKREMIFLRKQVWPMREILNTLTKTESDLIDASMDVFLRDVSDHIAQIMDAIDSFRDMLSGMLDLHLSFASNRMNEVMKVLTIIATIFIPLTFVAGIYGMNFKFMPELDWRWGYFAVWTVNVILAGVMLYFFRKKSWL